LIRSDLAEESDIIPIEPMDDSHALAFWKRSWENKLIKMILLS
jgi:hypothetical protein